MAAFGIGAGAGALGAATGGAAFGMLGGAASGAGGGIVGSAVAMPVQSLGNAAYFNTPFLTWESYLKRVAIGGILGGAINGGIAAFNGRNFWTGNYNPAPYTFRELPIPATDKPLGDPSSYATKPKNVILPKENHFVLDTRSIQANNAALRKDFVDFDLLYRPQINGYNPRVYSQTDLYHNFPVELDETIVQQGALLQRVKDGSF